MFKNKWENHLCLKLTSKFYLKFDTDTACSQDGNCCVHRGQNICISSQNNNIQTMNTKIRAPPKLWNDTYPHISFRNSSKDV